MNTTKIGVKERANIYKEAKIVLWGAGDLGRKWIAKLLIYDINIVAICDNNVAIQGEKIEGIPIISAGELYEMVKEDASIVVQIMVDNCKGLHEEIRVQLESMKIENYLPFSYDEIYDALEYMRACGFVDFTSKFQGSKEEKKIRLTKIDHEFSIYRDNQLILWGDKFNSKENLPKVLLDLLEYHEIKVVAICDYNDIMEEEMLHGIPVIKIAKLQEMIDCNESIILQSTSQNSEESMLAYVKKCKIASYVVYREAYEVLSYSKICRETLINKKEEKSLIISEDPYSIEPSRSRFMEYIQENNSEVEYLFISMVGKTGDNTLHNTFNKWKIPYFNIEHCPEGFSASCCGAHTKIKFITAIREPIGRYLSGEYQWLSGLSSQWKKLYGRCSPFELEAIIYNGGDVQYLFDELIRMEYGYGLHEYTIIGRFMKRFDENIINTRQIPFDPKKGCTIVKEGNIEVFIYQLEKMNDIIPELSQFVGTPFTNWEMGNVASDKWIAESYKQAQKEIKFTREFFDMCYNDPYIRHFYSEEDIEGFKDRWRSHVR